MLQLLVGRDDNFLMRSITPIYKSPRGENNFYPYDIRVAFRVRPHLRFQPIQIIRRFVLAFYISAAGNFCFEFIFNTNFSNGCYWVAFNYYANWVFFAPPASNCAVGKGAIRRDVTITSWVRG